MGSFESIERLQPGAKRLPRINHGGNFCGHNPDAPRWHFYQAPKKCLPIQKDAQSRLKSFYWTPSLLPRLCCVLSNGNFRAINKDGSHRQISSERRESLVLVLMWVIGRLNFATGKIGVKRYHDGNTHGIAIDTIADELNLSYSSVQRSLAQLNEASYMDYDERYETFKKTTEAGQVEKHDRRVISIRSVSPDLFAHLGIAKEKLAKVRDYARQKWEKARKEYIEKVVKKRRDEDFRELFKFDLLEPPKNNTREAVSFHLKQLSLLLSEKSPP